MHMRDVGFLALFQWCFFVGHLLRYLEVTSYILSNCRIQLGVGFSTVFADGVFSAVSTVESVIVFGEFFSLIKCLVQHMFFLVGIINASCLGIVSHVRTGSGKTDEEVMPRLLTGNLHYSESRSSPIQS